MKSPATILVVEDEPNVRFFLQEMLKRDGHEVTAVDSAETALQKIALQEFDLALIDLKLKGIGGVEFLSVLREKSPYTTAIMLTGYATVDTAIEALRRGASDYLKKPCKVGDLRESVRKGLLKREEMLRQQKLLSQVEERLATTLEQIRSSITNGDAPSPNGTGNGKAAPQNERLQLDRLAIDFSRHLITLDGHPLALSPTEFTVLAYLAQRSPRVIEPEELVYETQGYHCDSQEASRIMRYHIYRIRQKIREVCADAKIIRTVRGVGYTIQQ